MKLKLTAVGVALGVLTLWVYPSRGAVVSPPYTIAVDEFGNGTINGEKHLGDMMLDWTRPLEHVQSLMYLLPFQAAEGDVVLTEPSTGGTSDVTSDVIRFVSGGPGATYLIFYSDKSGGIDEPADTPGLPLELFDNNVSIPEVGPEGSNGAHYVPTNGQPGYAVKGATYHFYSDVPEPVSLIVWSALGGLAVGVSWWRRRGRQ
jgi:hypothetical protein